MKRCHMPYVDARYWLGITLASVFGTNLGDLYAHDSGLGIFRGLLLLLAIAALVFVIERRDRRPHQVYYWLVIIIIRTGATNIADYLAYRVRIPGGALTLGLAALLAGLAWRAAQIDRAHGHQAKEGVLPDTGAIYWLAMLTAGVFGTVLGDVCSHAVGQGRASIGLGILLAMVLLGRKSAASTIAVYWVTVAVARTAGTAMGDFLAEGRGLGLGLALSTLITGTAFAAVLVLWRGRRVTPVGA